VTLAVLRGSFTALTGASGSGKSTLLALMSALDRPTSGQVLFDGNDLASFSGPALARVRRRMGFIFQDFALIPDLSVWENITYPLIPRAVPRARRRHIAQSLLDRFGPADRMMSPARELSGGEQQRVAIARALAGEPEILFADEPTSNLDPVTANAVKTLLVELSSGGTTVVIATHDPQLSAQATHRHELRAGRLVLPG
jgi:putative ABC transport system ATP-binding protein